MNNKELLKYIINEKEEYKDYIYKLYSIYDLCSRATGGNIDKNKDKLELAEKKIYTINGKPLTEDEKIYYEIKNIYKVTLNLSDDDKKEEILQDLVEILRKYKNRYARNASEKVDKRIEIETKEEISVMQARLNLPISFLYAASKKFKDIYDAELINSYDMEEKLTNYSNNEKLLYNKSYFYNDEFKKLDGGK